MKRLFITAICVACLSGIAAAQDAKTVIANAQKALGDVKSITYSGSAKDVSFQQCGANAADMICKGTHDPMRPITNYVRAIDLTTPASRATGGTNNIGAGGSTTVTPGNFSQQMTAQQLAVSAPWSNSIEFYITPWGFLKGAAENNATVSKGKADGKSYTVLSWSPSVKSDSGKNYVIKGYVNPQNIVERVETWVGDNLMGDMHVLAVYSGWKDFGGVMAPAKIVQTRGEWPYFEVTVTAAKANPPDLATLGVPPPPAPRGGAAAAGAPAGGGRGGDGGRGGAGGGRGGAAAAPAAPPAQAAGGFAVTSEKLGDGLYRLTSTPSGYDSMIVEFKSYIMMLEAGQGTAQNMQGRAVAYLAEIKKLYPNKPIRYVFNTHPHSDHTGGLPAVVAEGATIITQQNNVLFFERALNTPRTLLNDPLAKNPKKVKVEGVAEKKVYSDGTRTVEFYHVPNAPHSNGLLFAYIPKEKVLFQGDFTVNDQPANDHVKALFPVLEKLNLDFNRYIPVHTAAAPQTKADVWKSMGK